MIEEKRLTCGVLLYDLNPLRVFLVREGGVYGRVFTGEPGSWGIPKGGLKKGKSAFETALCELQEETGVELPADAPFEDLGLQPYNWHKDILAWALRWLPPQETCFSCSTGRKRLNTKTNESKFVGEVIAWRVFLYEEALAIINHRQAFLLTRFIAEKATT